MKKGMEAMSAAFSMLPMMAMTTMSAPSKYVNESPGSIFAGYLLKNQKAMSALNATSAMSAAR